MQDKVCQRRTTRGLRIFEGLESLSHINGCTPSVCMLVRLSSSPTKALQTKAKVGRRRTVHAQNLTHDGTLLKEGRWMGMNEKEIVSLVGRIVVSPVEAHLLQAANSRCCWFPSFLHALLLLMRVKPALSSVWKQHGNFRLRQCSLSKRHTRAKNAIWQNVR